MTDSANETGITPDVGTYYQPRSQPPVPVLYRSINKVPKDFRRIHSHFPLSTNVLRLDDGDIYRNGAGRQSPTPLTLAVLGFCNTR